MSQGRWEIPSSWEWTTAGEIAEVVGGGTPRKSDPDNFEGGQVPWVTPADLSGYTAKYIAHGRRNITEKGLAGSAARLLPEKAVLFSSRAPIGYVAIAQNPLATNQGFKSFVLPKGIEPEYVYYYLQRARHLAIELASGTTFLEISGRRAARIPIPIAPEQEQRRIVAAIESYLPRLDNAVAGLGRVERNLTRYRASVLQAAVEGQLVPTEAELARVEGRDYEPASELLKRVLAERRRRWEEAELERLKAKGKPPKDERWRQKYKEPAAPDTSDLPELPAGWCWISPGQLFDWKSGDFLPTKKHRDGDVPVYGGNGVNGHHDEANVPDPVVVIGRVGAHCGNIHLTEGPTWITDNAIQGVPVSGEVQLAFWAMTLSAQNLNAGSAGTGQPYVNQRHLNSLRVPMPPSAEQGRIASACAEQLSVGAHVADDVQAAVARTRQLHQAVLTWAFAGKLVDQDPDDEPAAVLLERIRKSREADAGKTKARRRGRGRARG